MRFQLDLDLDLSESATGDKEVYQYFGKTSDRFIKEMNLINDMKKDETAKSVKAGKSGILINLIDLFRKAYLEGRIDQTMLLQFAFEGFANPLKLEAFKKSIQKELFDKVWSSCKMAYERVGVELDDDQEKVFKEMETMTHLITLGYMPDQEPDVRGMTALEKIVDEAARKARKENPNG
jgi:hypothetical protein